MCFDKVLHGSKNFISIPFATNLISAAWAVVDPPPFNKGPPWATGCTFGSSGETYIRTLGVTHIRNFLHLSFRFSFGDGMNFNL